MKERLLTQKPGPPEANLAKERPSWDQYFMSLARLLAGRSTCLRREVGAVLVRERRVLATGYNGAPSGMRHCAEVGCLREQMKVPSGERHELCRGLHAEQNVIIQAAQHGIAVRDSVIYTTSRPCSICSRMIINAGIVKIFYCDGYEDPLTDQLLEEAGIPVVRVVERVEVPG
ncbi:MAG: cytidine/deoxycytidylate deaminase family protein [Pseudomonadota bacterium]